jgi:hypothetical protein
MKKIILILVLVLTLGNLISSPVAAASPKLTFTTGLASDGVALSGSLLWGFNVQDGGTPGVMHTLTLNNPVAIPNLTDGDYGFYLKAAPWQVHALTSYFAAKGWSDPAWYTQINAEITGTSPFFYLHAQSGVYSLVDGFRFALFGGTPALTIDDDYPSGFYMYAGQLKGINNAVLNLFVKLNVK